VSAFDLFGDEFHLQKSVLDGIQEFANPKVPEWMTAREPGFRTISGIDLAERRAGGPLERRKPNPDPNRCLRFDGCPTPNHRRKCM
jgi:hypothetical protein